MTSVSIPGVSSGSSQQAGKLALLAKLFQTTGRSAESGKTRNKPDSALPQPPPHPSQTNSAAGLASMFEALQNEDTSSVSDLLSRLLQAIDTDGDGAISAYELQAVTELATGQPQGASHPPPYSPLPKTDHATGGDQISTREILAPFGRNIATVDNAAAGPLSQTGLDQVAASLQNRPDLVKPGLVKPGLVKPGLGDPTDAMATSVRTTSSAYEALYHSLQVVFAQGNGGTQGGSATTSSQRYTNALRSLAKAA